MKVKRRFGFPTLVFSLAVLLLTCGSVARAAGEDVAAAPSAPPAAAGPSSARLGMVRAGINSESTTLTLEISGDFTYFSSTPGERLVFVDLPRVLSIHSSDSHLLQSPLVSSYRIVPYMRDDQACARLEVLLKQPSTVSYQQLPGGLQVKFLPGHGRTPSSPNAPATPAGFEPAAMPAARTPAARPAPAVRLLARGNALERVNFGREGGATVVRVEANGPVECHAFSLPNPRRLVLDIPHVENRLGSGLIAVGLPPVKSVHAGQFSRQPLVARVVVELEDASPYDVRTRGNTVEVQWKREIGNAPEAPSAPRAGEPQPVFAAERGAAAVPAEKAPEAVAAALPDAPPVLPAVALETPAPRNAPKPEPAAQPEAVAAALPDAPPVLPAVALEAPAPRNAPKPEPAAQPEAPPAVPAPASRAPEAGAAALAPQPPSPPVQPPAPPAAPVPAPVQAQAPPAVQAPVPTPAPTPSQAPAPQAPAAPGRYTGEPISVNLKDVDLKDFFRLMHEVSGLNVVLDPTVSGRVTLVMEDVPWDQVLDIVLRNNGLDKQLEGNVLRIAQRDTLRREQEGQLALEQAKQAAVERVTVMRPLNYARATQVMATLTKFRSPRGELVADDRTNTLIITDIPQAIPTIDDIIKQLDKRSVQVEIEARIVSATRDFARDVGTQFGFGTTATGGRSVFGGNVQQGNTSPVNPAAGSPPTSPFVTLPSNAVDTRTPSLLGSLPLFSNFPVAATSGLTFAHRSPNFAVDLVISLAESKGLAKTLSRPRIITQNNVQGQVMQGVQVPVQTTINNTVSAQMVNATLTLTVRPQVTNEGSIFLEITVENNSLGGFSPPPSSQPMINTQRATTSVLVNDGDTIVFGGVVTSSDSMSTAQVPVLGSVPVLGNIFKNKRVSTDTRELLFFITPKIV